MLMFYSNITNNILSTDDTIIEIETALPFRLQTLLLFLISLDIISISVDLT